MEPEDQQILASNELEALFSIISPDRMGTYLTAAGGDRQRAARLYIWNARMGEAFHIPIQAVEVGLRNRINAALIRQFGDMWWKADTLQSAMDDQRIKDLIEAERRICNRNYRLTNGQIVATLSFGFWAGMLQKRYKPVLWSRQFRAGFPNLSIDRGRGSLAREIGELHALRNRISHHEPIIGRDLSKDYARSMTVISWLCPVKLRYIRPYCRVPALLREKP